MRKERLDTAAYPSCPGPMDAAEKQSLKFKTHGLSCARGSNRVHRLYVVFHGRGSRSRSSSSMSARDAPVPTWIGCVVAPEPIGLNAVVGLDDGGFVATNYMARDIDAAARAQGAWRAKGTASCGNGTTATAGRSFRERKRPGPNGLEMSPDGKWLYVAPFGSQALVRLSRGQATVKRDSSARISRRQRQVGARWRDLRRGPGRRWRPIRRRTS